MIIRAESGPRRPLFIATTRTTRSSTYRIVSSHFPRPASLSDFIDRDARGHAFPRYESRDTASAEKWTFTFRSIIAATSIWQTWSDRVRIYKTATWSKQHNRRNRCQRWIFLILSRTRFVIIPFADFNPFDILIEV